MTGRISVFLALCVLGAAVVAAITLRGSGSQAALTPVPSFHVDIGSSFLPTSTGNSYVEDPNGDGNASDQLMSVDTITRCVRRDITDFAQITQRRIVTDIIIRDAQELVAADVRINYDPAKIQFVSATMTPFTAASDFITGFTGQVVGLINLPAPPYTTAGTGTHATAGPGFSPDNTNGAVLLGGTWQGTRTFARSSESGPTIITNSLPERNFAHAPDGGVLVRINWDLLAASDGQDVIINLTEAGPSFTGGGVITAATSFTTLRNESPAPQGDRVTFTLGEDVLFDGLVRVNAPDEGCVAPVPPAPTATSTPTITPTPGPTATSTPTPTSMPTPPTITLAQDDPATELVGGDHTVTATVRKDGVVASRVEVLIFVEVGPNMAAVSPDGTFGVGEAAVKRETDDKGEVELTYTSNGVPGRDTIIGCIFPNCTPFDQVTKQWVRPTSTPTATPGPGTPTATPGPGTPTATPGPGTPTAVAGAGGVPSTGNPGAAGGSGSDWPLYALAASLLTVAVSGSGLLWMSRRRIAWPWRRIHSGG